jgi:hypothetical protein
MTSTSKNILSLMTGSVLASTFVWLAAMGAAAPVPVLLQSQTEFVVNYYSGMVTSIAASIVSFGIVFFARRVFKIESTQQLLFCLLPMFIYVSVLLTFFGFSVSSLLYAAVPAALVSSLTILYKQRTNQ